MMASGWGRRDLVRRSRVDLCVFFPQFSTNSQLLGENKINRNPHNFNLSLFLYDNSEKYE